MNGTETAGDLTYSYRPSLLGAAWQFRLTEDALLWDIGRRSGRVAYRDIRRMRMLFRPVAMQSGRFLTQIWAQEGPRLDIASTSWKSMVEQERLDGPYSAFIRALHARLAQAGSTASFEAGSHPLQYWVGLAIFIAMAIGFAALIVRALQEAAWGGAAFIAAFLALFLWQAGNYFRRNRPGRYRPEAPPAELIP